MCCGTAASLAHQAGAPSSGQPHLWLVRDVPRQDGAALDRETTRHLRARLGAPLEGCRWRASPASPSCSSGSTGATTPSRSTTPRRSPCSRCRFTARRRCGRSPSARGGGASGQARRRASSRSFTTRSPLISVLLRRSNGGCSSRRACIRSRLPRRSFVRCNPPRLRPLPTPAARRAVRRSARSLRIERCLTLLRLFVEEVEAKLPAGDVGHARTPARHGRARQRDERERHLVGGANSPKLDVRIDSNQTVGSLRHARVARARAAR